MAGHFSAENLTPSRASHVKSAVPRASLRLDERKETDHHMNKFLLLVRRSTRVVWWGLLNMLLIAIAAALLFANYSGLRTAFALTGLDLSPLADDPLLGRFFDAFGAGEATQADLYAAALAFVVASAEIWVCHWLIRLLSLWRERREYRRQGEMVVQRYRGEIEWTVGMLLVGIPLLAGAAYWDLELFRVRAVMGSLGLDQPERLWDLADWPTLVGAPDAAYAVRMAWIAPIGYLCATGLAAIGLEWAGLRTLDAVAAWEQSAVDLFTFDDGPGGEMARRPAAAGAGVVRPGDDLATSGAASVAAVGADAVPRPVNPDAGSAGSPTTTAPRIANARSASPIEVAAPEAPVAPRVSVDLPANSEPQIEVLGGQVGERVTLVEAQANKDRYLVDGEGRRVWDRAYYEALHGTAPTPEPATGRAA